MDVADNYYISEIVARAKLFQAGAWQPKEELKSEKIWMMMGATDQRGGPLLYIRETVEP